MGSRGCCWPGGGGMFLFALSRQRASPNTSPAERMSVSVSLQEAGRPSCESMWWRPAVHLRLTDGTQQQLLKAAAAQTCNEERRDAKVFQPQQKRRTKRANIQASKGARQQQPSNSCSPRPWAPFPPFYPPIRMMDERQMQEERVAFQAQKDPETIGGSGNCV